MGGFRNTGESAALALSHFLSCVGWSCFQVCRWLVDTSHKKWGGVKVADSPTNEELFKIIKIQGRNRNL